MCLVIVTKSNNLYTYLCTNKYLMTNLVLELLETLFLERTETGAVRSNFWSNSAQI